MTLALSGLTSALVLLLAVVVAVVILRRFRAPAVLAYIVVGIVLGPSFLGLTANSDTTRFLAEIGVVFLMFSIGLEFSLPKLTSMRREVFGLGSLQVVGTMLGGMVAVLLGLWVLQQTATMPAFLAGLDWRGALVLAGAMAMSSTAIITKLMSEKFELDSAHGRMILGVLLFQDLAVVPLLVLTPALLNSSMPLGMAIGLALLKTAAVLVLLLFLGQKIMQPWFTLIARQRSQELFTLNVLLVTLGLAWVTELFGLSMALGSFVAGMLIAETQYRHTVEADIKPFRDVLLGLFFVTLGLQLDGRVIAQQPLWVLLMVFAPMVFKITLVVIVARLLKAPLGTSLRTGLILCTAGEFGFVLLAQADKFNLVSDAFAQLILASMLLSMMLTPVLLWVARTQVARWVSSDWLSQSLSQHQLAARHLGLNNHVVIIGYGRSGQGIAHLLNAEHKPYLAIDADPDLVNLAARAGDKVEFGDARKRETLQASGLQRATAVVLTIDNLALQLEILSTIRQLSPTVKVIVRTLDDTHLAALTAAGASEVVPEQFEGSLMLASHALISLGVPLHRVVGQVAKARSDKYTAVQAYFHSPNEDDVDDASVRLQVISLSKNSPLLGKTLAQLDLAQRQVEVINALGADGSTPLSADEPLPLGASLVCRGTAKALSKIA